MVFEPEREKEYLTEILMWGLCRVMRMVWTLSELGLERAKVEESGQAQRSSIKSCSH